MGDIQPGASMTTPRLPPPVLVSSDELRQDVKLAKSIRNLCNQAFSRHKDLDPVKWNPSTLRFPDMQTFYAMLTPESAFAVVFDADQKVERDEGAKLDDGRDAKGTNADGSSTYSNCKVIACAAAVPWSGGWSKEGAGAETGWEIKTVCVDGDTRYLRQGLAVQVLGALESHLVGKERSRLQDEVMKDEGAYVDLWILAAECINGVYWRKRGYEKVRSKIEGVGVWSCRTSFEMTVFRKRVGFSIRC